MRSEVVETPLLVAVDGNSLVHRSYHAQARTGQPAWAVRGLLSQLVAAVERLGPDAVVIGFDDPERSQRRERWPEYKAHRTEKLDTLVTQLDEAREAMAEIGFAVIVPDGLEADDVLASSAACAARQAARTVVVTSDRDAFALIDERTSVLRVINGGVEASPVMTPERLVLLLGVRPEQYRDFAALRGDPSDNLQGVRGVGPRTAARLLAEFGSAAAAFADLDAVREKLGGGVARRLGEPGARESWTRNCQVMAMRADVPVEVDLRAPGGPGALPLDAATVESVFRRHNLTWTAARAAEVLGGAVRPIAEPEYASAAAGGWERWSDGSGSGAQRLPRLPARRARSEQLALF